MKRYKIWAEDMPEEIQANNLKEAVEKAHDFLDIHEIDENGEINDTE
jgi:hypothetical protein